MPAESNRLADVIAVACAEAFRGNGEIFGSGMGTMPMLGARLARATFEPDLLVSDGVAFFIDGDVPITGGDKTIEGWVPFRSVFDTLWGGRRHVMMGASQIDRHGNSNISNIGDWKQPKVQLLGVRGGPGNTINHDVSYWIPKHSSRVFVDEVDMVSGVGLDRGGHGIPCVITDLAVLDFATPERTMGIRSVHPGVTVDDVVEATGFDLTVPNDVPTTRGPNAEEAAAIELLDPNGVRFREIPD